MIAHKYPTRQRYSALTDTDASSSGDEGTDSPHGESVHTTTFRGADMELEIESAHVKTIRHESGVNYVLPLFGEQDRLAGTVSLGPGCSQSGQLSILVDGTFKYSTPKVDPSSSSPGIHECNLLASSQVTSVPEVPISILKPASQDPASDGDKRNLSIKTQRDGFRSFPFQFELPRGYRQGEEPPQSFSSAVMIETAPRGRSFVELVEVSYQLTAIWKADTAISSLRLQAPFIFQNKENPPLGIQSQAWFELFLKADRVVPFRCAITLPDPRTFSRDSPIPYFVIFTTTPASQQLRKEISSDATITVSLTRQISLTPVHTPPQTESPSRPYSLSNVNGGDNLASRQFATSTSPVSEPDARSSEAAPDVASVGKPLPELPQVKPFKESKTLYTSFNLGFPKRPKHTGHRKDGHSSLPDGLFKASIPLQKTMLPSIDWGGVSVKYYLDVSVTVGQDDSRGSILVQII